MSKKLALHHRGFCKGEGRRRKGGETCLATIVSLPRAREEKRKKGEGKKPPIAAKSSQMMLLVITQERERRRLPS